MGHFYVGTELSLKAMKCGLLATAPVLFLPFPLFLLDVALSFVIDTVLFPFDMFIKSKRERYPLSDMSCH